MQAYNRIPYWRPSVNVLSRLSQSAYQSCSVARTSPSCQAAGISRRSALDLPAKTNGRGLRQDALLEAQRCGSITGCLTGGQVLQSYRVPDWKKTSVAGLFMLPQSACHRLWVVRELLTYKAGISRRSVLDLPA